MTDSIKHIIDGCMDRNATIRSCMQDYKGISLAAYIELQRQKLVANNNNQPMQDRSDFIKICCDHVRERLGDEASEDVCGSLETGALHTADHLGGFYTPQSFQGDLLFSQIVDSRCIPCFAAGSVTLHSSTYGRGIQYFSDNDSIGRIPLFPGRYAKYSASLVPGIEEAAIDRAAKAAGSIGRRNVSLRITDLLNRCYRSERLLDWERFADQTMLIGMGIYNELGDYLSRRPLVHIETEEVSGRLFIKDAADASSLVHRILFDEAVSGLLAQPKNGRHLNELLFRGNDLKGHMFPLKLCEDGFLRGTTIYDEDFCISADPDTLSDAIDNRQIFVSAYLRALMLAFARGFTWYGGVFQAVYLPEWQKATVDLLCDAGLHEQAAGVGRFDASGYISGPIFALFDNGVCAAPAGPVEFGLEEVSKDKLDKWLQNTTLYDAHVMGMFEFYYDLFPSEERIDGWYETLATFEKANYSDNIILSDPS